MGIIIAADLKAKARILLQSGRWEHTYYVLFSKTGFTEAMKKGEREEDMRLFRPQEMVG